MAKAGSGDVLAGLIAAFLVQTKSIFRGAVLGVLVHACGGDGAREKCGGFGMLARDLIDGIQTFMRRAEMSKERKDEKI